MLARTATHWNFLFLTSNFLIVVLLSVWSVSWEGDEAALYEVLLSL